LTDLNVLAHVFCHYNFAIILIFAVFKAMIMLRLDFTDVMPSCHPLLN